jgi:hypothetical protein
MSFHGTKGPEQLRNESSYVHGQGWTATHEWRGEEAEILGLLGGYRQNGYEVRVTRDDPYLRLIATRGGTDESAEKDYYDKFRITKETLEKSIFSLPTVAADIELLHARTGAPLQSYRDAIESAVESGKADDLENALPKAGWPIAWNVFREMCRGVEAYETEYVVLARERVVSVEYYRTDVLPIPQLNAALIYPSSAVLRDAFGIPYLPGVTWPDELPNSLTNSAQDLQWGWRERRREIRFQEGSRVEIVQDWTFAEWSTNLYSVY